MKETTPEPYEIEDNHREISTGHSPNLEADILNQAFTMLLLSEAVHVTLKLTAASRQYSLLIFQLSRLVQIRLLILYYNFLHKIHFL